MAGPIDRDEQDRFATRWPQLEIGVVATGVVAVGRLQPWFRCSGASAASAHAHVIEGEPVELANPIAEDGDRVGGRNSVGGSKRADTDRDTVECAAIVVIDDRFPNGDRAVKLDESER
jgi:hypothetical protein